MQHLRQFKTLLVDSHFLPPSSCPHPGVTRHGFVYRQSWRPDACARGRFRPERKARLETSLLIAQYQTAPAAMP
jgi:hypothetical protein